MRFLSPEEQIGEIGGTNMDGDWRSLVLGHLPKRLQDGHKALARIQKPVHTVGAEALESEIAAEDFGDALRWQAGGRAPILFDQEFQLGLEDRNTFIG
jgi:hypothetical protein